MTGGTSIWPESVPLREVVRDARDHPLTLHLVADETARAAIARELDLVSLDRLEADLALSAWFDGALIEARWRADVVQTCGVSLEPFSTPLKGAFRVRAVPAGSPLTPAEDVEIVVDPEAEDPPDVLDDAFIDLGGYVIEHLALDIDPFPRMPGVEFESPAPEAPSSPFDVLKALKPPAGRG